VRGRQPSPGADLLLCPERASFSVVNINQWGDPPYSSRGTFAPSRMGRRSEALK